MLMRALRMHTKTNLEKKKRKENIYMNNCSPSIKKMLPFVRIKLIKKKKNRVQSNKLVGNKSYIVLFMSALLKHSATCGWHFCIVGIRKTQNYKVPKGWRHWYVAYKKHIVPLHKDSPSEVIKSSDKNEKICRTVLDRYQKDFFSLGNQPFPVK